MTKEEILEKSRKENKGQDEREKQINTKARDTAGAICMLLGCALGMLNVIADGPKIVADVLSAIYFCYFAVFLGTIARNSKKGSDWFFFSVSALACIVNIFSVIAGILG